MPIKLKQPSKKQGKAKQTKTNIRQRKLSSPVDQIDVFENDDDDIDQTSSSDGHRIDMKNLLKTLESQSKQKLIKKQTKTFEEIKFNLQEVLLERLNSLIQSQEIEFEEMVSNFFKFKTEVETQKSQLIDEVIQQQQLLQEFLSQLENNHLNHMEDFKINSKSTVQNISHLNSNRSSTIGAAVPGNGLKQSKGRPESVACSE